MCVYVCVCVCARKAYEAMEFLLTIIHDDNDESIEEEMRDSK